MLGAACIINALSDARSFVIDLDVMNLAQSVLNASICVSVCAVNCALHFAVCATRKSSPNLFCPVMKKTKMLGIAVI